MIRISLGFVTGIAMMTGAASAQDITLNYFSWDPAQLEIEQASIAAFEEANPGVTVDAQALNSDNGYWQKLSANAASGAMPDVFMMSSAFVQEWAEAGNLADLQPFLGDLSDFYASAVEIGNIDGKQVAFPANWVAPVLFFNKDMFDAAGQEYPQPDWTWEDFINAAKAVQTDEASGYYFYGRYAHIEPWVFRNGGRYLNDDGTAVELNQEAVNTLEFLTSLIEEHKVAPRPQDLEGIRQQDVFPLGMTAMWVDGSWNIANNRSVADPDMNWGIAQVPMGPDTTAETARAYAWADMLSVSATSEHKELAWEFIEYMTGEGRTASDFLGGKVPAYMPIALSEEWLERDQRPDNKELILEIGSQPVYTGFGPKWSEWRGYAAEGAGGMNGELDEVFNGRKSLDDAIAALTEYARSVLAR